MLKFSSFIFFVLLINACHSFNNRHDTLAVQCGLNAQTQNRILLRFTNPGGVELAPEQVAQLKVQFQSRDQKEEFLTPTIRACVALPAGEALVKARIQGQAALAAEIKLDAKAATDTIHTVELESPGMLELGLKCPANGLLAASTLGDVVEVKKSLGKLSGYQVAIEVYSASNEKVQDLFLKSMQDTVLEVPHSFDIEGLAEGSYSVRLNVMDSFHGGTNNATDDKCPLTIRRSCAKDEDFDSETVSCVPRLCDNAYRVGAKWTESLAQNRGKGHYECRLVNEKAEKTLLSHNCQAGFFKSPDSCLGATAIARNCALLENGDAACWGTLLGKDNFPSKKEVNYQTALRFPGKVSKFGDRCVELESGALHCWELVLGDNVRIDFVDSSETPKTWKDAIVRTFVIPEQSCKERSVIGLDCRFEVDESNNQSIVTPMPMLHWGACLVDVKGQVWCNHSVRPASQDPASTRTAGSFSLIDLPGPARQVRSESGTYCVLLVEGKVVCWGANDAGDVGSNVSDLIVTKPSYVIDSRGSVLQDIKQLASATDGYDHRTTIALSVDGRIFAWGSNLDGYLGNGTAGENDEGDSVFVRFAVPGMVELTRQVTPTVP